MNDFKMKGLPAEQNNPEEVSVMLDSQFFRQKPTSDETKIMVSRLSEQRITVKELAAKLGWGYSCRPGLISGGCQARDWKGQQCFFLDIDRGLTVGEALRKAEQQQLLPGIIYPSFRFRPSNQRFRMVFFTGSVIRDGALRDKIQNQLMEFFGCDPVTANRTRIFYGGNTVFWVDEQARLNPKRFREAEHEN